MTWQSTDPNLWQGRDDIAESPNAKRLFQVIQHIEKIEQVQHGDVVLLGFACDEGVRRNQGRQGAKAAPVAIRKTMASLAVHGDKRWWDGGDVVCESDASGGDLDGAQQQLTDLVSDYQRRGVTTLVLGGGHETAFAHGLGIYQANSDKRVGIINFDAHLDMRSANEATSGTPFLQLAEHCQASNRDFHYLCVGASRAANTAALLDNAQQHGANIIWDTDCFDTKTVIAQINAFIDCVDVVYLTVDLDVLPASQMFAVSAPAAFGIPLFEVMQWLGAVRDSGKLIGGDVVEYNPELDRDYLCACVAARLVLEMGAAE